MPLLADLALPRQTRRSLLVRSEARASTDRVNRESNPRPKTLKTEAPQLTVMVGRGKVQTKT